MEIFVSSGPNEILRTVQKDKILFERIQKHITGLLLRIGGTSVWLQHRQIVEFSSEFLYYCFTTLSGFQTLGEEYTNIVQVDASLRYTPPLFRRFLTVVLQVGGLPFIEYALNKLQRKIHGNTQLHEDFKRRLLFVVQLFKTMLPFFIHLHLVVFYWNGTFYNLSKRITKTRYITTKPWIRNQPKYVFKILATISVFHLSISVLNSVYRWFYTPAVWKVSSDAIQIKTNGNCSLCLEPRKYSTLTMCGHLYCWYCIFKWLRTSDRCPICRDIIQPSRIIPLKNYF